MKAAMTEDSECDNETVRYVSASEPCCLSSRSACALASSCVDACSSQSSDSLLKISECREQLEACSRRVQQPESTLRRHRGCSAATSHCSRRAGFFAEQHSLYSQMLASGLLLVMLTSFLGGVCVAAQTERDVYVSSPAVTGALQAAARAGYTYAGKVSFVDSQQAGVPVLDMATAKGPPAESQAEHYTVLVTSSGHSYTKRLATDVNDPELAEALSAVDFSPRRGAWEEKHGNSGRRGADALQSSRRLKQTAVPTSSGIASTDLGCDGCSGVDNRVQISNTEQFPFSAIGELTGQIGSTNRGLECTGTLIGATHVVTAAHCVFDINDSRQYVSSLNFVPGENGDSMPYGQAQWSAVRVLSQFTDQTSYTPTAMNYDFALITLKNAVTSNAGFLGMTVGQGHVTLNLTTAGYPGEKPAGTMWESLCAAVDIDYNGNQGVFTDIDQCQNQMCANIMSHTCLSSNGQSGSSMWDSNQRIRAILTGKVSTSDNQDINVATKIDAFVYNTIAQWYNEDAAADGSNNTLPAAPSGPQPAPVNSGPKTFLGIRLDWSNPVFIAIVVALCCAALAIILGLLCCISRACARRAAPKAVYGRDVNARAAQRQFMASGARGAAPSAPAMNGGGGGGYPSHYVRHSEHGVVYDERRGQFVVNGQPYGAYQFDADRGYYPTRGL